MEHEICEIKIGPTAYGKGMPLEDDDIDGLVERLTS